MGYNSYSVLEQAPLGIHFASDLTLSLLPELNFLWKMNIYDKETNSLSSFCIFNSNRTIPQEKSITAISIPTTSHGPHKGSKIPFIELISKVNQDTYDLKHSTIKEKEQK